MFDFAWSEIALIAVVALIAIGPKDMPVAIRAVSGWIKKARRMAAEFQTHVDEMVREADLHEVRASINEIRNFDVRGEIERTVDADGTIRGAFASNPLEPSASTTTSAASIEEAAVSDPGVEGPDPGAVTAEADKPACSAAKQAAAQAPAFIPPNVVPPPGAAEDAAAEPDAPAFIPPEIVLQRRSRPSV
jgi:sec-independent protein translocase protein TatB